MVKRFMSRYQLEVHHRHACKIFMMLLMESNTGNRGLDTVIDTAFDKLTTDPEIANFELDSNFSSKFCFKNLLSGSICYLAAASRQTSLRNFLRFILPLGSCEPVARMSTAASASPDLRKMTLSE